ncbi:MAG: hypothetical protein AAF806_01945 [Bacteroidota bacterium]
MEKTIFLTPSIEVLLVSAGGVGTTFLMDAISKYRITNCTSNTDQYKHSPIPPIRFFRSPKAIYVFGDPVLAVISLFRRSYHHVQSKRHNKYINPELVLPKEMTIDEYADLEQDALNLQYHFNNWYTNYRIYDTLFVHYNAIHDSLEVIRHFLSLPESFIHNFPEKKMRKSSIQDINSQTLAKLENTYQSFKNHLQSLDANFIRTSGSSNHIYLALLSSTYQKAYKSYLYRKWPVLRQLSTFRLTEIYKI